MLAAKLAAAAEMDELLDDAHLTTCLAAVAGTRDRQAFAALYSHFAPRIRTYMLRHGADNATADDLTQETMVQIWRKSDQYDPQKAAPSAWVYRIARNLQIDRLRRHKHHEVELTEATEVAGEGADDQERAAARVDGARVTRLVFALPAEQQEVVRLAYFDGLSHAEIGRHLSVPLGTVKSRLRLAFDKLRTALGEKS